jgi:hypothetical protein
MQTEREAEEEAQQKRIYAEAEAEYPEGFNFVAARDAQPDDERLENASIGRRLRLMREENVEPEDVNAFVDRHPELFKPRKNRKGETSGQDRSL